MVFARTSGELYSEQGRGDQDESGIGGRSCDLRGEEVVGGTGSDDGDGGVDGSVATSGVTGRRGRRRVLAGRRRGRGHSGGHGPLRNVGKRERSATLACYGQLGVLLTLAGLTAVRGTAAMRARDRYMSVKVLCNKVERRSE